jgi:hypothetical protein
MITDALVDFADDSCRRLRQLPWWESALIIAGTYPQGEGGVRSTGIRTFLIGRGEDGPPLTVTGRTVRDGRTWADVPGFQVIDLVKFSRVAATKPLPREGRYFNLVVVTHTRPADGVCQGKRGIVHHPEMDQPTSGEHLDDLDWVVGTLDEFGLAV